MSINNYLPHLLVLPEDEANYKIVNGFLLNLNLDLRSIKVLPYVGGWNVAVEKFVKDYAPKMRQYPERRMVLLIDFDRQDNRHNHINEKIPDDLRDRVFIIGTFSNPEELRNSLRKSFEEIGETISKDCFDNTEGLWNHNLLKHNKTELERMISSVKPFLFS
ncbi:hypothetical protein H6G20_11870 [Desertifilum sp. FACHB-1129]|uniref:Uncharacterized protein n=2 Tax=Desertifilum tharense IPPAS B-1220 TaxID=1781255 RepID=A0A1E5QNZ2_9CYAN|nr:MULTISPECIES: hypothetical protein [Desertifilum]MDA0213076.1 hypothetical protein [Cyanobacteria bacterium FC1]MBD2312358.1 hypothetical protein [Desertifilum sp. FACHB-1129]MBD2321141.1 hypothetical protein [Desertifilum sp. FACHB-866]MBD2331552.1 hypothetical protein [Desertifilum sp. FACHB-868]OEJ76063.1 hypothetical protein BH720_05760 [Desertifilum tharense IPPAS B-1220]